MKVQGPAFVLIYIYTHTHTHTHTFRSKGGLVSEVNEFNFDHIPF